MRKKSQDLSLHSELDRMLIGSVQHSSFVQISCNVLFSLYILLSHEPSYIIHVRQKKYIDDNKSPPAKSHQPRQYLEEQ